MQSQYLDVFPSKNKHNKICQKVSFASSYTREEKMWVFIIFAILHSVNKQELNQFTENRAKTPKMDYCSDGIIHFIPWTYSLTTMGIFIISLTCQSKFYETSHFLVKRKHFRHINAIETLLCPLSLIKWKYKVQVSVD